MSAAAFVVALAFVAAAPPSRGAPAEHVLAATAPEFREVPVISAVNDPYRPNVLSLLGRQVDTTRRASRR